IIRGNHDKVASGLEDGESFNAVARSAVEWTLDTLTPEHRAFLKSLPAGPVVVDDLLEICHGSTWDEDAYIFDELDALRAFESARRPVCLFGHTHVALVFAHTDRAIELVAGPGDTAGVRIPLRPAERYLINPGSVGQPRDGDPRACAALVDTTERVAELFRVSYAIEEAQRKIRLAGLPDVLARRLTLGR
ncbi:MAG TPA: metallophosphoesterase family protein, partial [Methylomirabilota bacterium]